jgi:putative ABC transport system permease protein
VSGAGGDGGAAPIGLGALAVFAGVVVLGPVIGSRFVRLVGAPIAAFRGMTGVLARDNASRNPKRTAATASALMIGVALVVLISVFASSARSSIDANIDSHLKSDWIVSPLQQDGLSPTVAQAVDALPETASVTSFRMAPATLDGDTVDITGIDPANVEQHLDVDVKAGAVDALGAHELGVQQQTAKEHGWKVGDDVTLTFAETGAQPFTIGVIYGLKDPLGDYTMSKDAFTANVAHQNDQALFVVDAAGVSEHTARTAIEGALATTPTARLHTPAEFKAQIAGQIDKMLNLIYVLLFMAVVIALFGIANTLALSVVERRRELGLMRAVGMQCSQVRSSVRWEAVLIALLGTAIGSALGLGFGWALVKTLSGEGIDHVAVPGMRLVVIAVVAAVAAVVAAALPARRAARLDVLDAISS